MFVGHLAVSLGAKAIEPKAPLPALVAASFGLDLVWPWLVLAGVETVSVAPGNTAFTPLAFESYPWSHSLLMAVAWPAAVCVLAYRTSKSQRVSLLLGALVVSHWVLDFVTHRPDLPLWPGGPKLGLGLWSSVPATIFLEGGLYLVAIAIYVRALKPRDAVGTWALWALVALTSVIWITQPWSPPPPSSNAVAAVALAMWIFPWWALWIDRHRSTDDEPSRPSHA